MNALVLVLAAATLAAPPDPAAGKKVFAACAACHDPAHAKRLGPGLGGIVGRKAASEPGFRYSGPLRRSGLTWTPEKLDRYLADSQGTIPGNAMPFPGIADAKERADLIAYLQTLP